MARRAVETFLEANPNSLPTSAQAPQEPIRRSPLQSGVLIAQVGRMDVFMFLDAPGRYYRDLWGKHPATKAEAIAAFGAQEVTQHRAMAEDLAVDKRIADAVDQAVAARDGIKSEEELREERTASLRAQTARAIREHEKKTQAAADKMITRDLDALPQG
jgi:hypothetical protein